MVVGGRYTTVIGSAELATISNRVVNCLSKECEPSESRYVFERALKFVEMAWHGQDIMKTGRLSANASDSLKTYGFVTQAFTSLPRSSRKQRPGDFSKQLDELRSSLSQLAEGRQVSMDNSQVVKELFSYLRKLALSIDTLPTDNVIISSSR